MTEFTTFASFYYSFASIPWLLILFFSITFGLLLALTGGLASGPAAALGTWIGTLMGYSGAAATSAGLALLGGGSIAAGGFGMVAGVFIVNVALTFSTELVFDYAISRVKSEYDYRSLTESSKNLPTLPLPITVEGPDAYRSGMEILGEIDEPWYENWLDWTGCMVGLWDCPEPPTEKEVQEKRQKKVKQAIEVITNASPPEGRRDHARIETLLALLHFISGDYFEASRHANVAHDMATLEEITSTLPAFIRATASIYDEDAPYSESVELLRQSILDEPDNPLIPLMFSIYLDRLFLRFEDSLSDRSQLHSTLREVFRLMKDLEEKDASRKVLAVNYTALLARYFVRLKLEQQKIMSLTLNPMNVASVDPKVANHVLHDALSSYAQFLSDVIPPLEAAKKTTKEWVGGTWMEGKEAQEALNFMGGFSSLLDDYRGDLPRLTCLQMSGKSLLSHYFANMDLVRSEILVLTNSKNELINTNAFTATKVQMLLNDYDDHLNGAQRGLADLEPYEIEACSGYRETDFRRKFMRFAKDKPKLTTQLNCLNIQRESASDENRLEKSILWGWGPQSCSNLERWR